MGVWCGLAEGASACTPTAGIHLVGDYEAVKMLKCYHLHTD